MIPWDYNLAFGGFANGGFGGGSGMTSTVNAPIDSPTGSTDLSDRPMVAWIFENEEYTALYHEIYQEFIDTWFSNHELETLIEDTVALISPYVEKDPTAFCTYEEFQTGAETIEEFVVLRAKSVQGQLSGTIPSTYEEQQRDQSSFIDASFLNADDMGSQNAGGNMGGGDMGGGGFQPGEMGDKGDKGGFGGGEASSKPDGEMPDGEQPAMPDEGAADSTDGTESGEPAGAAEELPDGEAPAMPDGETPSDGEVPEMPEGEAPDGFGGEQGGKPDGEVPSMPDGEAPAQPADGEQPETSDTEDNAPDIDAAAPAEDETPDADAAATADGEHGGDHQMGGKDGQDGGQGGFDPGNGDGGPGGDMPAMDNMGGAPDGAAQSGLSLTSWVELAASAVILLAGLLFAKFYKRRRS
jgi:hypothetical protein